MPTMDADNVDEDNTFNLEDLSMQIQLAAMLSFAYIWSLGGFVPFR